MTEDRRTDGERARDAMCEAYQRQYGMGAPAEYLALDFAWFAGRAYERELGVEMVQDFAQFRRELRQVLYEHGVLSNPAVDDEWIIEQLRAALAASALKDVSSEPADSTP